MDSRTRRRIRLLEAHAILSTVLLIVLALGAARLEFLDESGRVTYRVPEAGR